MVTRRHGRVPPLHPSTLPPSFIALCNEPTPLGGLALVERVEGSPEITPERWPEITVLGVRRLPGVLDAQPDKQLSVLRQSDVRPELTRVRGRASINEQRQRDFRGHDDTEDRHVESH